MNLSKLAVILIEILFLSILLVLTPIIFFFYNENFFLQKFNEYEVYKEFNQSEEVVTSKFKSMLTFLRSENQSLDSIYWSTEDKLHLQDVKNLFTIASSIWIFFVYITITYIIFKPKLALQKFLTYSRVILILSTILLMIIVVNFNDFFTIFHKILFHNPYWLLDPTSSNLIKYFQNEIFYEIAIWTGIFGIITTLLPNILWIMNNKIKKF